MITYYLLSSEIESPAERARDKPSLLKNSRVRSGKSLFGNNLTKEWHLKDFLSQRQCAVARIRFPGYLALRKIDAFSKVPLIKACSFITTPSIQAHVSLATINIFISFQIKLQQMKLY